MRFPLLQSRPSPAPAAAAVVVLAALLAGGCASRPSERSGLLQPYRFSIPQGNYVTREMLAQVKPGMTPEQVRFALGTPLVTDTFHPDRWEYVFRYQYASGRTELRHATVFFADGKLARVEDNGLPERDDPNDPALPGSRLPQQTSK